MAYNFGVDQNDVMLTMVSFASQHEFFNLLGLGAGGTLAWIAYACGLIGFLMLVAMPSSWTFKNIASWFILFLIVLIRPLGEPVFFSNPAADESVSMVDSTVCFGNVLNSQECAGTTQGIDIEGLSAGEMAERQAPMGLDTEIDDSFKVFSPQAATIDVINDLHYGIATQLNDLGPRVLDRQFAALETIRRNSSGNTYSAYAIADFLASCGARYPEMARVASLASDKVIERYPDLWGRMGETQLIFADGVQMFRNYDSFRRGQSQETQNLLYPTMICAPGSCNEGGALNAFDEDPNRRISTSDLERFSNSILYSQPQDFLRIARPGSTTEDGGGVASGVEQANTNLTTAMAGLGEDATRDMMSQKVSLIVPINVDAALQGNRLQSGGDLSPYRDLYSQVEPILEGGEEALRERCPDVRTQRARSTASLLERAGRGIARGVEWLDSRACRLVVGTAGFAARTQARTATFLAEPFIGPKVEFGDNEPAYVVANCAQMHMIANIRHNTASADLQMFGQNLRDIMEENADILANESFDGLEPRAQTALVLNTIMEARRTACSEQHSNNASRRDACINNRTAQLQEMSNMNSELSAAAAHPMAEIMVDNASDLDFVNGTRDFAAAAGEVTAPFFIGLKAMIGGFGAGTYSEIMPRIVSFAISLMVILTPLIFMIGLLMPSWSFGILVMSVVVIAYFLLTKVVFSMISIVMSVFVAGKEYGIVSHELGNFADLVVGSAYTSAFILTGLFMFSLKNPLAAIQQVAGAADKASTVSGAEALAAAMTVVKGAKLVAGVATGGAGAAAAIGSMSGGGGGGSGGGGGTTFGDALSGAMQGYGEGQKGGISGLISGDSAKAAREASMSKIAINKADRTDAQSPPKTQNHYDDVERGRRMKADSEESTLVAKANGYSSAFKDQDAIVEKNGHKYTTKVDGKGASIEAAFQKIGQNGEPVREVMRAKQLDAASETIRDSGGREGRVEHKYDISVFEQNSSATRNDFKQMAEKGLGELLDASGSVTDEIHKATHFLRTESKGAGGD